jgi:glycine C-acetyltransferase
MVMIDECHATGFIERQEKEHLRQRSNGKSRYYNWNSWKALGGAMGGYTTAKKEIIELRQRSRPYLFSNSLAPAIVGASIKVLNYWKKTLLKR